MSESAPVGAWELSAEERKVNTNTKYDCLVRARRESCDTQPTLSHLFLTSSCTIWRPVSPSSRSRWMSRSSSG